MRRILALLTLTVIPRAGDLHPGDIATVDLLVSDVTNLAGFEIVLSFDPEILAFEGVEFGSFLRSAALRPDCAGPRAIGAFSATEIAAMTGAVRFRCFSGGVILDGVGVPGPSGTGTLFTARFVALSPGVTPLEVAGLGGTRRVFVPANISGPYDERGSSSLAPVEVCSFSWQEFCGPATILVDGRQGEVRVTAAEDTNAGSH